MFELSKMFLLCLNYWKLETPTQYRQRTQKDDGTAYKVDYTRCVHVLLGSEATSGSLFIAPNQRVTFLHRMLSG